MVFAACNMKFCKNTASDSEDHPQAQQSSFAWDEGLCSYEGFFDSTKTTKQQIQNAYLLLSEEFRINNSIHVYKLEDIKRINKNALKNLEKAYLDENKRMSSLELPKNKAWENLRQEKLRETKQLYKLYKIVCEAYLNDNMKALKEFDKNDQCLTYYSDVLIQEGDSLLSAWESFTEQQASQNSSPERLWAEYHEQRNSENKFQHAKVRLLTFAWWNCANEHIEYFDRSKGIEEFNKLFTSINEICDTP